MKAKINCIKVCYVLTSRNQETGVWEAEYCEDTFEGVDAKATMAEGRRQLEKAYDTRDELFLNVLNVERVVKTIEI